MATYQLTIVTPQGQIFNDQVESLTAPGSEGRFGVLANHTPMVTRLTKGVFSLTQNQSAKFFVASDGLLEVTNQSDVLVLADDIKEAASEEEAKLQLREALSTKKD